MTGEGKERQKWGMVGISLAESWVSTPGQVS